MRQAKPKAALLFTEAAPGDDWADYPMFQYIAALNPNFRRHCVKMAMALNAGSNKALTHFGDAIHAPDPVQQALQGSNGAMDQPESTRVEEMNMSVEPECVRMDKRVATSTRDSQGREYNVAQTQQTMIITNEMWGSMMARQDAAENRMKSMEEAFERLRQTNVGMVTEYKASVKQHHALRKDHLTTAKMLATKLGELTKAHNILFRNYKSYKDATDKELVKGHNSLVAGCEQLKASTAKAADYSKKLKELVAANNSIVTGCEQLKANAATDRALAAQNYKNATEDRKYLSTIAACVNGLINVNNMNNINPGQMQVPISYGSPPRQQIIGAQNNAQANALAPGAPLKPSAPSLAPMTVSGLAMIPSPLNLGGIGAMMQPPPPPPPPSELPSSSVVGASSNSNAVGGVGAAVVDAGMCGTRQESQILRRAMEVSQKQNATEKVAGEGQQRVDVGAEGGQAIQAIVASAETELQEIDRSLVWAPGYVSTVVDIQDLTDDSKFRGGANGKTKARLAEIVQRKSGKRGFAMIDVIDYEQNPPKRLRVRGVENFKVVHEVFRRPWINASDSTNANAVTEMQEFYRVVEKKEGAVVALAEIQERLDHSKFMGGREFVSVTKVQHLFKAVFGIKIKDLNKIHVPTDDNPPVFKTVDGFRNFALRI